MAGNAGNKPWLGCRSERALEELQPLRKRAQKKGTRTLTGGPWEELVLRVDLRASALAQGGQCSARVGSLSSQVLEGSRRRLPKHQLQTKLREGSVDLVAQQETNSQKEVAAIIVRRK